MLVRKSVLRGLFATVSPGFRTKKARSSVQQNAGFIRGTMEPCNLLFGSEGAAEAWRNMPYSSPHLLVSFLTWWVTLFMLFFLLFNSMRSERRQRWGQREDKGASFREDKGNHRSPQLFESNSYWTMAEKSIFFSLFLFRIRLKWKK